MDIFAIRDEVVDGYREFTTSFVDPHDERIRNFVTDQMDKGAQWPDPRISLNPFFASGGTISEAVAAGHLHPDCARIFRIKADENDQGKREIVLHKHQLDAIQVARSGSSYVLTTGTGSGKSLAYIIPIVDRVLRDNEHGRRKSVKAIVVYPMNALANSQRHELEKFLTYGFGRGREPVTFARYTGQESDEERQAILANPPDILLTNYVMLELLLTRPQERDKLIRAARGLQFLVLDELHTYRGRQGADVSMLVRRVREACEASALQCVGTSATMASGGTRAEQRRVVAGVASRLFGADITADRVIGETLERATDPQAVADVSVMAEAVKQPPPTEFNELQAHPLASWIESTFGLTTDPDDGFLVRQTPTTVTAAAEQLAELTATTIEQAQSAIKSTLSAGSSARHPQTDRPLFAFRIHQFLSKGDNVYVSLEPASARHITDRYQVAVPNQPSKALYPLAFCRECGQEYLSVAREERRGDIVYRSRSNRDGTDGANAGYLYVSDDLPWPLTTDEAVSDGRIPDSWLSNLDGLHLLDTKRKNVPRAVSVMPDGTQVAGDGTGLPAGQAEAGTRAAFVPSPFQFCLRCQVSYESRSSDFTRLASMATEGRSSAVTVVTTRLVKALREVHDPAFKSTAKKLLTFVDNRQDASLQAGHVNDFVQVSLLRAAVHAAVQEAGPDGVGSADIAAAVLDQMRLPLSDYGLDLDPAPRLRRSIDEALRKVVAYRLYGDLERGWRIVMPNLEQTGLLRIEYEDLDWLAAAEDRWDGTHPALRSAESEQRREVLRTLLDELRRALAIDVDELSEEGFQRLRQQAGQYLREPWSMEPDEKPVMVKTAYARGTRGGRGTPGDALYLSPRGAFGRYLRSGRGLPMQALNLEDTERIIDDLMKVCLKAGLLREMDRDSDGYQGYRVNSGILRWTPGDGLSAAEDVIRRTTRDERGLRVNPFFQDLYRETAASLVGIRAKEHTAQVSAADRERREEEFREHPERLPMLFCSPTMELGVDISSLNAVAMRNVPPTPANYAQRSGRAGRSGQPAIVLTYCATGNAHDAYYFKRSGQMVSGSVAAPRLDLTNEDLVRSHLHSVWLAETGLHLGRSMLDLLDVQENVGPLDLLPEVKRTLGDPDAQQRAMRHTRAVLDSIADDLAQSTWFEPDWPELVIQQAPAEFDRTCNRWRELYRAAAHEQQEQNRLVNDPSSSRIARNAAIARRREAEAQLRLLLNEDSDSSFSDFYPYRYFASEGFLPGYSFPRLPLAAFIPSVRRRTDGGEYLQRARFLAISEFGPGSLIYHEGARYQVERVQLPAASPDQPGSIQTVDIKRCQQCGYLHETEELFDECQHCGEPLGATTYGLMQLRTVFTRRRERISSDEEERRRSSFELQTSYRFADRGTRPGSAAGSAVDEQGEALQLTYGDAATVRVANLGRRNRKAGEDGFWLNTITGKWLTDRAASETTEDGDLDDAGTVQTKRKVIPFVEDSRNILIARSSVSLSREQAVTLRHALERGIEAEFQLEGGELASQELPDPQERARMLFMEANEGGAGVLRRLVDEPEALARAARRALDIAHFDPDTGADLLAGADDLHRCEKACYDCLLAYDNQIDHTSIDRHSIRDLLLRLSGSRTEPEAGQAQPDADDLLAACDSSLEREFIRYLLDHSHRLPSQAQRLVEPATARPDFIYETAHGPVAVFLDGPAHDGERQSTKDSQAEERLQDLGWLTVRIRYDDDWGARLREYESVFGAGR